MTYRVLSLFAGIGGFDLGLERTGGFQTVAFCEIDPFCQRVLAKHWPGVPIHKDIQFLSADDIGDVDVIVGGFPCQPFSSAARGRHVAEDLWPDMRRMIAHCRPRYVIAENVQEDAIERASIEIQAISLRYRCYVRRISANDAGADHQRDRWWAVAYPDQEGELPRLVDAEVAKLPQVCSGLWGPDNYARAIRVLDGVPNRLDRVGAIGNAVLPHIPEAIGRAILACDSRLKPLVETNEDSARSRSDESGGAQRAIAQPIDGQD